MMAMIGEIRAGRGTISREFLTAFAWSRPLRLPVVRRLQRTVRTSKGYHDKRAIFVPDAQDGGAILIQSSQNASSRLAGGDPVTINKKGVKQELHVMLRAKIILVANVNPNLLDDFGALAEREVVIRFRKFVPANKRDPKLTDKLKDELSGIANWACRNCARLRANNGQFTIIGKAAKAKEDLKNEQQIMLRFRKKERLEIMKYRDDVLPLKLAFEAYRLWALCVEGLSYGKIRDKSGLKKDMMAALQKLGVGWADKQMRWHDPHLPQKNDG